MGLKRLEEAVVQFGNAVALDGGYARAYANMALALQQLGRGGDAKEALQQAVALDPGNPEAMEIARQMGYRVASRDGAE